MNVILIAGLGPALMETEDLTGSLYDQDHPEIRRQYYIGGRDCTPERLVYQIRGESIPLLRPRPKLQETDYISETLKSILSAEDIPFHFIPIRQIWADEVPDTRGLEGESIVCLSTTFMWNERMLNHSISWIFQHLNCRYLVVGGQYGVLKQEYLLQHWGTPNLFLQTGEAELSLVPLIRVLQAGGGEKELCAIPNLLSKRNFGTLLRTTTEDFDFRSVPRVHFRGQNSYIPYMSMRGCPYRCKFCALRECTPKWQYQTADRIFADWRAYAQENGARHFTINDSTFFIPYDKISPLLKLLKGSGFTWDANARADTPFDASSVKELEEAGCTALFFGFESMCSETLKKMDKRTTPADNRRINYLFANSSITTKMSFIVGFPGETPEDFAQTRSYLVNEHVGRYSLYVFEYEGDILPIGKEKDKYQLELLPENGGYHWAHAGEHWKHCGMDSDTARLLQAQTIRLTRIHPNSMAVYRTWQDAYAWPFVPELDKEQNLRIEKLLDQLVFAPVDAGTALEVEVHRILQELEAFHIVLGQ